MAKRANAHDIYFKQLFSRTTLVASFCANYLPRSIARSLRLEASGLTPVPTEFLDRQLRERRADLAYRIPRADGSQLYVYLVLEHKSSNDPMTPIQIMRYCMGIWEAELAKGKRRVTAILPVVIYHGKEPWRTVTDLGGMFDAPAAMQEFLPRLLYHLVSLSPHDPVPSRGIISLRVGLEVLQSIFRSDFEARLATAIARLAVLRDVDLIFQEIVPILTYAARVHTDLTAEHLERFVEDALSDFELDMKSKALREFAERGRQEGLHEGLLVGFQEAVTLGLEIKFGAEGLELVPEIRTIHDVDTLRAIRDALPRIRTVDEIRTLLN